MFRKDSFFIKVFIPVIIVMLLQTIAVSVVLNVNGTIHALETAAIATLSKNTENRGTALERMMVYYWSNLDRLEMGFIERIDGYLEENGLLWEDVYGDFRHETSMLDRMSQPLISTLRTSASTGVFMYFLEETGFEETRQSCNGLYYRDLDPLTNPTDNSDIMYLRGHIDIARKDRIQLDSLWSELFTFDPLDEDIWRGFSYPQIAADQFPLASSVDLAYWNGPHLQNPLVTHDSNKCITYTRPIFYDGQLVAMIGTEVQVVQLEKYFPANDFENNSQSGYILISYDTSQRGMEHSNVFHVTGSYIKRLIGSDDRITLIPTRRDETYSIPPELTDTLVQAVQHPIRLYNTNAPFSNEQWALVAMGTENMLFSTSRNVNRGILLGSSFVFVLGCFLLVFTIRKSTEPLISIAYQIEKSGHEDQVFDVDSKTYEINLLCSTLNSMRERRSLAETQVRQERQRYLVALESATNTFMEYDTIQDSFMLYYFTGDTRLLSKIISPFKQAVSEGEFCHPDDQASVLAFLKNAEVETIEIRSKTSVFSHITDVEPDGNYFWFMLKASNIYDDNGNVSKIIGTAREITREKLDEFARKEASKKDPTTGFYNRDFGIQAINHKIAANTKQGVPYLLYVISIDNFDKLESFYGRVFGGFVLMEFSDAILSVVTENDLVVRLSNNDFLIYFGDTSPDFAKRKESLLESAIRTVYTGENSNIIFCPYIKSIASTDEITLMNKPISILLDINKATIVSAAFELFERSSDIHSSLTILLGVLGKMFNLDRIIVSSFDARFGMNQITYQWANTGLMPYHSNTEKISHSDLATFEASLDENGTIVINDEAIKNFDKGVLKLLCITPDKENLPISAYCCVMYDNALHAGRVSFISNESNNIWTDNEKRDLCDIVKMISAHISIDKSRSASRAKSEFLSRISHEIRTPMNAVIGMTEIAKSAINNPEQLLDSLNKIDFSAKHLLILINDVLEMSRIESGKLQIESKPFTLNGLVLGIETLMRFPIEDKKISFTVTKKYRHNQVIGDEYRLRQVLVNLLGNASKFTDQGGSITFLIEQLDTEYSPVYVENSDEFGVFKFSVIDNGIGISPEDQLLIFEAFEQVGSPSVDKQQGTGLGLTISNSIISAMGSKIELDSKLGEGATFHFTIAMKLGEANEMPMNHRNNTVDYKDYFKGKRALLVDDIKTNIVVATFTLNEAGFETDVAYNGQQAVDMVFASEDWYYDIIFMDVKMPVMDGLEATARIRSNTDRFYPQLVPIVAMTANAYDEDVMKSIEAGMNGHIVKPIEREKLLNLINNLIK